ncbi:hypothetical protein LEMLEM_LOCUS24167 [Lemmus lemmus]
MGQMGLSCRKAGTQKQDRRSAHLQVRGVFLSSQGSNSQWSVPCPVRAGVRMPTIDFQTPTVKTWRRSKDEECTLQGCTRLEATVF